MEPKTVDRAKRLRAQGGHARRIVLAPEGYRKEAERIRQEAEKATGGERVTLLRMARMDERLAQHAEMLAALRSRHD